MSEPQPQRHSGETVLVWVDLTPDASVGLSQLVGCPRSRRVTDLEGPPNRTSIGGSLGPLPRTEAVKAG